MDVTFNMDVFDDVPNSVVIKDEAGDHHYYKLDDARSVTVDVISLSNDGSLYIMRCPACLHTVAQHSDYTMCNGRVPNYCTECGQHLAKD